MARPFKLGLQYFPLDVNFFDDERMMDLNLEYGIVGEIIYIRLLTMIYSHGYLLEMAASQVAKHLVKQIGNAWSPPSDEVEVIIEYIGRLGLLDNKLLQDGVFTSRAIQKQFLLSARRRRGVDLMKHWLLTEAEMMEIRTFLKPTRQVNDDNNPVNDDSNRDIADDKYVKSTTSTQKEKEKKKEIDKLDKYDKGIFQIPTLHYLTNAIIRNKYIDESCLEIVKYNDLFKEAIDLYGFDDCMTAVNYIVSYSKHANPPIDDLFSFMKKSLLNNLAMFKKRREFTNESFEVWFKRTFLQVAR